MFKVTPNPPEADTSTSYDKAADRALDYYLKPKPTEADSTSDQLFTVVNGIDTEVLLANLSETLASANAMTSDLAFELDGSRRHVALGIQQLIELGALLANRALDNVDPR
ncbi:hypothetical protein E3Z27_17575 [Pseudomonas mediterranea]|jgi:hypothetical protein|uniref:DUF3077 domain-containing protein n=1 Tax=Pseudomonas mediterranea TaxID=183795 RepID=A0AAX2DC00_9PSED|nr:DUF6124 family protein [Pseudomonas mediterranea]KGU86045.1 hypothetical protein N005_08320 [Pseudomonas mediterranea CFBP 5447]MBL0842956.1 hypothetical protein [Pseudomonas mediterranea]MDU9028617.1 DUF6124 family protein [Pseudomonas mediterranea]QHA83365.1 hypothetical protein E3Z27_17575 [Pseudomonas mediterranea]UZD99192.1 DUF6124 family protein [Pseudomonas mediterranea]